MALRTGQCLFNHVSPPATVQKHLNRAPSQPARSPWQRWMRPTAAHPRPTLAAACLRLLPASSEQPHPNTQPQRLTLSAANMASLSLNSGKTCPGRIECSHPWGRCGVLGPRSLPSPPVCPDTFRSCVLSLSMSLQTDRQEAQPRESPWAARPGGRSKARTCSHTSGLTDLPWDSHLVPDLYSRQPHYPVLLKLGSPSFCWGTDPLGPYKALTLSPGEQT